MSSVEEKLTEQIVQKSSNQEGLAIAGSVIVFVAWGLSHVHVSAPVIVASLVCSVIALVAATRRSQGVRFLPEGIDLLGWRGKSTFISYVDISRVERVGDEVAIEAGGRVVRLGRDGSREPYVSDVVAELVTYLEANVAEARALADDREAVVAFFARGGPASEDYRHAPAPREALEAVARSRVMPARLRVDAANALGAATPEELAEESPNASENERRRV
jgi:hypothetical protein